MAALGEIFGMPSIPGALIIFISLHTDSNYLLLTSGISSSDRMSRTEYVISAFRGKRFLMVDCNLAAACGRKQFSFLITAL